MRTCAIILALCGLSLAGCATGGAGRTANVPHLRLRDINGRPHVLSDYVGQKVVVMAFWATWCMPCRQELAVLHTLYERHRQAGLEVLAISVDGPETLSRVRPFIKQYGLTFPVLIDSETRAAALYNPRKAMPMLHIFDRGGRIVYTHTTYQPGHARALKKEVLDALGPVAD